MRSSCKALHFYIIMWLLSVFHWPPFMQVSLRRPIHKSTRWQVRSEFTRKQFRTYFWLLCALDSNPAFVMLEEESIFCSWFDWEDSGSVNSAVGFDLYAKARPWECLSLHLVKENLPESRLGAWACLFCLFCRRVNRARWEDEATGPQVDTTRSLTSRDDGMTSQHDEMTSRHDDITSRHDHRIPKLKLRGVCDSLWI